MFDAYFVDSVTLKIMAVDKWGEKTVSSSVSLKARIDYSKRMVLNFKGEQVVASAVVWLKDRSISFSDLIVFDGVEHTILSIGKDKDFTLNKILKVIVA